MASSGQFDGSATNTGRIDAIDSSLAFNGGLTNEGDLNLINTTISGAISNSSIATIAVSEFATFTGDVAGPTDFEGDGTVVFEATYRSGTSPAAVSFGGNLVLGGTATLGIELTGPDNTGPATQFDQLLVSDEVSIDGSLNVLFQDNFVPTQGDRLDIVTASQVQGTFNQYNDPPLSDDRVWNLIYQPQRVTLLSALLGDMTDDGLIDNLDLPLFVLAMRAAGDEGGGPGSGSGRELRRRGHQPRWIR